LCGILGFNWKDEEKAKQIARQLEHRGPDKQGVYSDKKVTLGFRRLSIIDVSEKGSQPMADKDETLRIVFNGELYNFQELRKNLEKKYAFRGNSDTETILYAFKEWGPKCVERFNGMWALCIYDQKKQRLFLSRDRQGKKPLYYYHDKEKFIFGSELKAILAHDIKRDVDQTALAQYLAYGFVPEPRSIFKKISKLEPGTNLFVDVKTNALKKERFWQLKFSKKHVSEAGAKKKAQELIDDATRRRLIADVPVGTFLSGGIDSSIVTASIVKAREESGEETHSFAVGFDYTEYDESQFSKEVAEHLGTNHKVTTIGEKETLKYLKLMPKFFDEPFADSSMIPTFAVSKLARKHVTVALSGDGGDETFGGYRTYVLFNMARKYAKVPLTRLGNPIMAWASGMARKAGKADIATGLQKVSTLPSKSEGDVFARLMSHAPSAFFSQDIAQVYAKHFKYQDWLDNALNASFKAYLPGDILHKVDRASMANSLEVRAPLLDYRITEFAATLPNELKLQGSQTKVLLKKCYGDVLPRHIVNRPKKGFSVPVAEYLMGALGDEVSKSIDALEKREWFRQDTQKIQKALTQQRKGVRDWSGFLYGVHMLDAWAEKWFD